MPLCRFYRLKISSSVDEDLPLPATVRRHIDACATCHAFYEQELSIARTLSSTAAQERIAAPVFLQARTLAALDRQPGTADQRFPWARLAAGTGLAAGVIAIFFAVHTPRSNSPGSTTANVSIVRDQLAKLESRLPDQQQLTQWSATMDEPLDRELQSLFHDARNAAHGLVRNFVPDSLTRSLTDLADPQGNP